MIAKRALLLLIICIYVSGQTCPQLCTSNCSTSSCSSCYSNFTTIAIVTQSTTCNCPDGLFQNPISKLCQPCPTTCLTCTSYTNCTTCIPGYLRSNSFGCISGAQTSTGWVSKNISFDLTPASPASSFLTLQISVSSTVDGSSLSSNSSYYSTCSKLTSLSWLGGYNIFGYSSKLIKSSYGLPDHQWINIRFQTILIDFWQGNTMVVEVNSQDSYDNTVMESPIVVWKGNFNSNQRNTDFCGNANISDSIAVVDVWIAHNISSLKFRVRLIQSQNALNTTSNLGQLFYGVREMLIRVGTCGRNCKYCSSPSQCTQCYQPYALVNGVCSCNGVYGFSNSNPNTCQRNCIEGQYYNVNKIGCVSCSQLVRNCQTCNSAKCKTCAVGFFLFLNANTLQTLCVKYCPAGFRQMRNVANIITLANSTFNNATNSTITTYYNQTYYRDQCAAAPTGCSASIYNICIYCLPSYFYYQGNCITSCPQKTTAFQGTCRPCPINCVSCSSPSQCSICTSGYALLNFVCSPLCTNSTLFASPVNNSCNLTCDSSCLHCFADSNSTCTSCPSATYLYQGSCVSACPTGNFYSSGLCMRCQQQCSSCVNLTSCSQCKSGYFMLNSQCYRVCPLSYTPSIFDSTTNQSNVCISCGTGCRRCLDADACFQCSDNYIQFNFTCLNNYPLGYYYNDDLSHFKPCPINCIRCRHDICIQCASNWFLNKRVCVSECPPEKYAKLSTYYSSHYKTSVTTLVCAWKSSLCEVYSSSLDQSCQKCSYLSPSLVNYNSNNISRCLFSCPQFFSKNSEVCLSCPANCRRCDKSMKCLQCLYNYVINSPDLITSSSIQTNTCILNYCPPPYFSDSVQCQPCPNGCNVCQMSGECINCATGYIMASDSRICVTSNCTLTSTYFNSATNLCNSCSTVCRSCVITSTACTSCPINSNSSLQTYLYSSTCVGTCPSGYFQHIQSLSCRKCNPKCQTCSDFFSCLTCTQGFSLLSFYSLSKAECVAQCPIGFYSSNGQCNRCYQDCKSCFGPSQFQCLSCYPNFSLDDNKCVYFCGLGKYSDQSGHCEWCHSSCRTCTGPAKQQCLRCENNQYLSQNHCFSISCPGQTYLAYPEIKQCQKCQIGCTYCDSPQFCHLCTPGYFLYKGWCYNKCPENLFSSLIISLYKDTAGYICKTCLVYYSSKCLKCDESSCKKCVEGYYLYRGSANSQLQNGVYVNEQCYSICPNGTYSSTQSSQCLPCSFNCRICLSPNKCQGCNPGYNIVNGYCSSGCSPTTYQTAYGNCSNCSQNCLTCTSLTTCSSCINTANSTYYLFANTTSSAVICLVICPTAYFRDDSGWCQRCAYACSSCVSANSCSQCLSGFTLYNGYCMNSTNSTNCSSSCQTCSNSNCLQCNTPYFLLVQFNSTSQCVLTCPIGYYQGVRVCQLCNSSCLACSNTLNNCTQCGAGLYLYRQSCISTCPVGYFASAALHTCQNCPENCVNCQNQACTVCQPNYNLYLGKCYYQCPIQTYQVSTVNQCFNCPIGCRTCSSLANCTGCNVNLYLSNGSCISNCPSNTYSYSVGSANSVCLPCISPCFACTGPTSCISCIGNYILNGTICQLSCHFGFYARSTEIQYDDSVDDQNYNNYRECLPCNQACITCSNSPNNCQQCAQGYILAGSHCVTSCPQGYYNSSSQGVCKRCQSYCIQCFDSVNCLVCSNTTILYDSSCYSVCPIGYFSQRQSNNLTNSFICTPCNIVCMTCNGSSQYDCRSCASGYYMYNNLCLYQCPNSTYPNTATASCSPCPYSCLTCSSSQSCITCRVNYTISSTNQCNPNNNTCNVSNCRSCLATNNNQCAQCKNGYFLLNYTCVSQCPSGTYSNDGLCRNCSNNCMNCSSSRCLNCLSGYYLYQGECYSSCPSGTQSSGSSCRTDPCLYYNSSNHNCLQCNSPYLLSTSNQDDHDATTCVTTCPSSTVQVGSVCQPCGNKCKKCLSQDVCTSCSDDYYLYQGVCQASCPIGTYPYHSTCKDCTQQFCLSCTYSQGSQYCKACDISKKAYLYNGSCVLICPHGMYGDSASGKCINCQIGCSQCQTLSSCSSCLSNFYIYNGNCVSNCPTGTYSAANKCNNCSTGCYLCTSVTSCSLCMTNYSLTTTNNQSTCTQICPIGTYSQGVQSTVFPNSNQYQCQTCYSPCLVCSSSTSCSQCVNGYSLYGTTCVNNCPSGYFSAFYQTVTMNSGSYSTNICKQCSSSCLTCQNTPDSCTSCYSGFILDSTGNCQSNCVSPTTYYSASTRQCYNCSQLCYSCYGSSSNNCLSCNSPLQLYYGSCLAACPFGYLATSTFVCQPCAAPCASCELTPNNCLTCQSPFLLQRSNNYGSCVTTCSNGYFDSNQGICAPCGSSCLTCNSTTSCTSCASGLYLIQGLCQSSCVTGSVGVVINNQGVCITCSSNCQQCIYYSTNQTTQCTQCSTGLYLVNGACSISCPPLTYPSLTSYTCNDCGIPGCQNCILNSTLQVSCINCQASYLFIPSIGSCVLTCPQGFSAVGAECKVIPTCSGYIWNGYCLAACPQGTYSVIATSTSSNITTTSMTCQNCSSNCYICSSSSYCQLCTSSTSRLTVQSVTTVNGNNVTSFISSCVTNCPSNYYALNGTCMQCPSNCPTCQLASDFTISCLTCANGFVLFGSVCMTSCPFGYFANTVNICEICAATCASCNITRSNCTSCKSAYAVTPNCNSSIQNCTTGTYQSANSTCSACDTTCSSCFGGNSNQCLTCKNSTNLLINGQCLAQCPANTVQSGSSCWPCPLNCATCIVSGNISSCTVCAVPYILSPSTNQCILSCADLYSNTTSYYLSSIGQCQPCTLSNCIACVLVAAVTQCQTCASNAFFYLGFCYSTCPNGTYPNSNSCLVCPTNCVSCSSSGCIQCSTGFILLNGACVTACPTNTYLSTLNNVSSCQICQIQNCQSCSATACQSCKQPYTIDNLGYCQNCINGYFYSSTAGSCLICASQCLTCSVTSTNCLTCTSGYIRFNSTCISTCPQGYYADSTSTCIACTTPHCKSCPGNSCQSCLTPYIVVMTAGVLSCSATCPPSNYLDIASNQCFTCSSNCLTCTSITNCQSCSTNYILYAGYCLSVCPSGFASVNFTCVPCLTGCKICTSINNCTSCESGLIVNSNGSCSAAPNNCSSGYYLNSLGSCSQCYPSCATCNGGSASNCLTCFNGFTFTQGVCVQNCNATAYYSTSTNSCQICSVLFTNCLSCNQTRCSSCSGNYSLVNGSCLTVCPNGTFISNQQCISCSPYCTICTSSNTCIQCLNTSFILFSGQCSTQCPAQTFVLSGTCQSCSQICISCFGSATNCSSCITPYLLSGNNCVTTCPNGTYGSNYTCQTCSTNCLLCTGSAECFTCASNYYILNGTCRSSCPSGYYLDVSSSRCIQCVPPCLVCTSRTSCTSCQSPYLLVGSNCNSNCSAGTYYNSSLTSCTNCSLPHCGFCTANSCGSCATNYFSFYTNGVITNCSLVCPPAYFPDTSIMNCTQCYANCDSCRSSSWCFTCSANYYLLVMTGSLVNECVSMCPSGYYANSTSHTCTSCSSSCSSCFNTSACQRCVGNYYIFDSGNNTSRCVNNCPSGYFTPTVIDGSGRCGACPNNCINCADSMTCIQCISSSFVIVNGECIPSNCVNCFTCDSLNNVCQLCLNNYYLFNSACVAYCPDGYYAVGNVTIPTCKPCMADCLLCSNSSVCALCIPGYIFVSGSGCVNEGLFNFGTIGNMSGFTSNITQIVGTVYVSTSAGPIAFGALSSTYGPMQFCQFLYLLQGSTGGNEEMNTFLSSLSVVSYTQSGNSNSSSTSTSRRRLLTSIQYTSSFLATNAPIFIIMLSFICSYIVVNILQRYNQSCCVNSPCLRKYISYICQFMNKRFKYIYVDCIMWISYLPFLYFSILQLQNLKFNTGLQVISTLLAIVIIIVYPLYPIFILRLLFDTASKPQGQLSNMNEAIRTYNQEHLKNYKAITLKLPLDEDEVANRSLCQSFTCCQRQNPDTSIIEMSLSPFIDKVVRPVYNEDVLAYKDFVYFKKQHWVLAYAAIKYIRKFLFVLIAALCPNPTATISLLAILCVIYMCYLIILKPKEKLYLILEIVLQSVLLFFLLFMLIYVASSGATVSGLSIATHAIGFIIANSTLVVAIILNIMSYYTIFCCIVDLVRHLKNKAEIDQKEEKKFEQILDQKENFKIQGISNQDDDPQGRGDFHLDKELMKDKQLKQTQKRGDDQMTIENDDEEFHNDPMNFDEKEFNVRSSMINKKKTIADQSNQIPDLRQTNSKTHQHQHRKRKEKKQVVVEEDGHTSEEMGQSKLSNPDEIEDGLIKQREKDKYKRVIEKGTVNVDKGQVRDQTDKFKRNRRNKVSGADQQQSNTNLHQHDLPRQQIVQDVHTHDRIVNRPGEAQLNYIQRETRKNPSDKNIYSNLEDGILRDRQGKSKQSQKNSERNLPEISTYNRQANAKKEEQRKRQIQIQQAKIKERQKAKKDRDPFGEFADMLDSQDKQQKVKELQAVQRQKIAKQKQSSNNKIKEDLISGFLVEPNMIDRQPQSKKPTNDLYIGSDEEEIGQVQTKQRKKGDHRRVVRHHQPHPSQEQNINAISKDINTRKLQKIQSNKQFAEDALAEVNFKERQSKQLQKMQSYDSRVEQNKSPMELGTYDVYKNIKNNQKSLNEPIQGIIDLDNANLFTQQKKMAKKKEVREDDAEQLTFVQKQKRLAEKQVKKGLFADNVDVVESVTFQTKQNQQKKKGLNEQFQQEEENPVARKRDAENKRVKDNRMQMSDNLEETYEDVTNRNKQQIFKQKDHKVDNLIDFGAENDFEEISYERPVSKMERPSSRNKDQGLKGLSKGELDVSEDESKDIRRQRNSAIQKLRVKSTLNVKDSDNQDQQQIVGNESRRVSKMVARKKRVKGTLNIEDNSEDEDIEHVHL